MAKIFYLQTTPTTALKRRKSALLAELQIPSNLLRASNIKQFLTCGKPNCRCRRGHKHGPFHYVVQCLGVGKVRKFLLKTPAQQMQARAAIAVHTEFQNQVEELSQINAELLRRGEFLRP